MNNNNQEKKAEIKIADNIPGADYANLVQIGFNKEEFQMAFMSLMGLSGRVASKIITNPGHFKRMIDVMQNVLKQYEEKFGAVEKSAGPDKEIGFKA